jgi:sugar lactone lactonase YvrE
MSLANKQWIKFIILILVIAVFMLVKWANKKIEGFAPTFTPDTTVNVSTVGDGSGNRDIGQYNGTFRWPVGVVCDSLGNVYVCDRQLHKIFKIDTSGNTSLFAGSGNTGTAWNSAGTAGFVNGPVAYAKINRPYGLAVDSADNIYVADSENHAIRKITQAGIVSTVAGGGVASIASATGVITNPPGRVTQGVLGYSDQQGTNARFAIPNSLVVDSNGNIYVCDNYRMIRKIDTAGNVSTYAGSGNGQGRADGNGTNARFSSPQGIAVDSAGNLYVADSGNHRICKIDTNRDVTAIAGHATARTLSPGLVDGKSLVTNETTILTRYNGPFGIALDKFGNIYIAEYYNNAIRKIDISSGSIENYKTTTIAGTGVPGNNDGPGSSATFRTPNGLCISRSGILYVADAYSNRVRKIVVTPNCLPGQYADGIACAPCASGYFNPSRNQTSCQTCRPGSYSQLTPGSSIGASNCKQCVVPLGTLGMSTSNAATSPASCKGSSCLTGYGFDSNAGTCTACVAGKFSPGGTSICSNCPGSSYSTSNLASNCMPCASNQYTASTGANSSNLCLSLPSNANFNTLGGFLCMLGFSQNATGCATCVPGTFNSNAGASNCGSCGVGTYSGGAASNCTNCLLTPGSISVSSPSNSTSQDDCIASGCYAGYGLVSGKCIQCAGGFYGMGGTTTCSACPQPGYTTPLGSSNVTACYCANKNLPPKAQGSGPRLLAALNTCIPSGTNVYNFTMDGNVSTANPCTGQSFYDFDKQKCVDGNGNVVDPTSMSVCGSNRMYSDKTNSCLSIKTIVKPGDRQLTGTTGTPGPGDYTDCTTADQGDCKLLFKGDNGIYTTTNPCLATSRIYNFATKTCGMPVNPCCRFTTPAAAASGGCIGNTENIFAKNASKCPPNSKTLCCNQAQSTNVSCQRQGFWSSVLRFKASHTAACTVASTSPSGTIASPFIDYTDSSIDAIIQKKAKRLLRLR